MYDISLPTIKMPELGQGKNEDYILEHYAEWEEEVLTKLKELGYPTHLWPSDTTTANGFVRFWKVTGRPLVPAPVDMLIDKQAYDGPAVHPSALKMFNESFKHVGKALFCITKGEDWWVYDKAFLVSDANSYMKFVLYTLAQMDPTILDKPAEKKLGRPRNEVAHAVKLDKSQRYQDWLHSCEAFREELSTYEIRYREAKAESDRLRMEFNMLKARGAPKWIP